MPEIAKTLAEINACTLRRDVWGILRTFFHGHGVTMLSYHSSRADGSDVRIHAEGFPEDWVCHYIKGDLVKIDPIPALAARMAAPFYWHEIAELTHDQPSSDTFVQELEEAGLGDGLAFYVFGPGMRNAYVGLGFGVDRIDIGPEKVFHMQCVAQAGHLKVCALEDQQNTATRLTPREREVLEWVARGKSNSVVADILGVSSHTVDTLMRRI